PLGDVRRAVLKAPREAFARVLDRRRDLLRPAFERSRHRVPDIQKAGLDRFARPRDALHDLRAVRRHVPDDALADVAERAGDLLAAPFERARHLLADIANGFNDAARRGAEFVREPLVRAADGVTDALAVRHDGLALRHEFVDQRADADFVVAVGALKRRDFAADQGFEFAGAGERALDAVPDRRDLPAHGLGYVQDGLGRDGFGLRQAHRDFADSARD